MKHVKCSSALKIFIFLQAIVMIYSLSSVMAKFASGERVFSVRFVFFYGLEFLALAVYAILWQQAIKKVDLSIAYANRAMNLLWAVIWAILIFKESVSVKNIVGVIIVSLGILIVNSDGNE